MIGARVKQLMEEPHTHKAAEEAVGLFTDNGRRTKDEMAIDGGQETITAGA